MRIVRLGAALVLALAPALASRPAAAQAGSAERFTLRGSDVAVWDLAGRVEVVAGTGSEVVVEVVRRGRDAGRVRVERGEIDGRDALRIGADDTDIVYPELADRGRVESSLRRDGTFGMSGGRWVGGRRVSIRRDGRGTEGWADVTVRVPRGMRVRVHVLAGRAEARDVDADVLLDAHAARAVAERTRGRLVVDAGSGGAELRDVAGDVTVDAGSGAVSLERVRASVLAIDAGSGRVRGSDVEAPDMRLDTGSGGVTIDRLATRTLRLDSGSGDVDLGLVGDVDDLRIDSGSGSVTLRIPPTLGATLEADTGSGGITTEIPIAVTRTERHHLSGAIGDGRGTIRVDGGSGQLRLLRAR
jgi:hypothetical protein